MECRCYRGDKNRTKLVKLSYKWRDLAYFVAALAFLGGVITLRVYAARAEFTLPFEKAFFYVI